MKKSPNWLEMPDELMSNILQRLGTKDILKSARKVCTTWQRICKDPEMWKVIEINRWQDGINTNYDMEMLIKQAVDLSCGELIDISIGGFCTDDILNQIVLRSSKLKRLSLWYCNDITGSGLSRAVKRVPQLEELHNTSTSTIEDIEVIGQYCPQLKSFRTSLIFDNLPFVTSCDDHIVAIAQNMPNLRHLIIYGDEMTNDGFQAIVNGFPHLQYLCLFMRHVFYLDRSLVEKCKERIKDFRHNSKQNKPRWLQ